MQVKEVLKHRHNIWTPILCCRKEVKYRYGKTNIAIPLFMDDIATVRKAKHIRIGLINWKDGKGKEDKLWSKKEEIYES